MNIRDFDKKYESKGGSQKFIAMKTSFSTLKDIGDQFGVGKERVRQWMWEMFGERYNPRKGRRDRIVNAIVHAMEVALMTGNSEEFERFKKSFNRSYIKEAINKMKYGNN